MDSEEFCRWKGTAVDCLRTADRTGRDWRKDAMDSTRVEGRREPRAGEGGGQLGASLGVSMGTGGMGRPAGSRGGASGGAFAARILKTTVEERFGAVAGGWQRALERTATELADIKPLVREEDLVRYSVAWGRNSVQKVVVDVRRVDGPAKAGGHEVSDVLLRAFCKEGLFSRGPTAKIADRVWAAVSRAS